MKKISKISSRSRALLLESLAQKKPESAPSIKLHPKGCYIPVLTWFGSPYSKSSPARNDFIIGQGFEQDIELYRMWDLLLNILEALIIMLYIVYT